MKQAVVTAETVTSPGLRVNGCWKLSPGSPVSLLPGSENMVEGKEEWQAVAECQRIIFRLTLLNLKAMITSAGVHKIGFFRILPEKRGTHKAPSLSDDL